MLKYTQRGDNQAFCVGATPDSAPLHYVGVEVHVVHAGQRFEGHADQTHEHALILLTGRGTIRGNGLPEAYISGRVTVFEDIPPYVVYVSSGDSVELSAETECEVVWAGAFLSAPSAIPSHLYTPQEMPIEERGEGTTARWVKHLLEKPGQAMSLRLVEVITPGGHWSSFPPHKHDQEVPGVESMLEELYYYHISPSDLWAFQRVYDNTGWGEALSVNDGDLVTVPRGYHPVSVPPGATAYYLNVMAGPTRTWHFTTDPRFAHVPGFAVPEEGS